ncbi:MAG: hypothetical protein RQ867_08550 [Mariprofundaceae bacterium]|nr:hypothetical protein [Mariprofundaceae bacterium]
MKKAFILITGMIAMAATQPAIANGNNHNMKDMQHGSMHDGQKQVQGNANQMKGMFLVKKEIDGFIVSFHAMKAKEGMQHGGTHNFMVKVEKDGKALSGLMANSKVVHPDGAAESKMLMGMGDWYMAGYDLGHEGRHQLMVLFKAADGAKHFGGVWYPDEGKSGH